MLALLQAIITEATCGEGCWEAREDVCRCSCGGRNHGSLRSPDGQRPARTAKIDGRRYVLRAADVEGIHDQAAAILATFPPASVSNVGRDALTGKEIVYRYHWKETDKGSPVRVKPASKDQLARWPELAAWRDRPPFEQYRRPVMLLWLREDVAAGSEQAGGDAAA
ncbi:MAG TPA: hypothetical protein VGB98_25805 [Pyrinomonadaceae bacterium]|jgi:hypothetical protein